MKGFSPSRDRLLVGISGICLIAGIFIVGNLLTPMKVPTKRQIQNKRKPKPAREVKPAETVALAIAPAGDNRLAIRTPPQTKILVRSTDVKEGVRQSLLKLESTLAPSDLQIFYTDLLLKDWIIMRDDLTEGVGWSGVFRQIDENEKSIGVFARVKTIGPPSGPANPTTISILKTEEL